MPFVCQPYHKNNSSSSSLSSSAQASLIDSIAIDSMAIYLIESFLMITNLEKLDLRHRRFSCGSKWQKWFLWVMAAAWVGKKW